MTLCYAHRGLSGNYPENTMLAFQKALEVGAEGIELDVHLSADGVPVIIHDETLDRTTSMSGPVGERTVAELSRINAPGRFGSKYGETPIPTLREYLDLVQNSPITTNIELKTDVIQYEGLEETVLALIEEYGLADRIIISSFHHPSVLKFRDLAPHIRVGFLEEFRRIDPVAYLRKHRITRYHPDFSWLTPEDMAELKGDGIEVNVWTVNSKLDMTRMLNYGVDIVITNYPDRFLAVREAFQKK